MLRVAIIGAGIAGLSCGQVLRDRGCAVTLFDKGRGPGGRTSTRRAEGGLQFDHGAQYFTVRDPEFTGQVLAWEQAGVVAEWTGRIVSLQDGAVRPLTGQPRRMVGVPGMNAMARSMAGDLNVELATRIVAIRPEAGGWVLQTETGGERNGFSAVVLALPPAQAAALLQGRPPGPINAAMHPCWAVMAAFEKRLAVDWDGAFVGGSPLAWVARESSRPGRAGEPDRWVLHATPSWTLEHLDWSGAAVADGLLEVLEGCTDQPLPASFHRQAHRWLYSAPVETDERLVLWDAGSRVAVCGDWLAGGRVEGAFVSGRAAARAILSDG